MKHISEIVRAFVRAEKPALGLVALAIYCTSVVMVKLPWRSFIGLGTLTALGANFRWHDVERVWALLP